MRNVLKATGLTVVVVLALASIGSASASAATRCEFEPNGEPRYANPVICFEMVNATPTGVYKLVAIAAWLVDGSTISESEGALSTEAEGELELVDLSNSGGVLCRETTDGNVSSEGKDEVVEILNAEKERVGAGLPLLCKKSSGSTCEENATDIEVEPINLPWTTQLALTESGTEFLDYLSGGGEGKEPGWKVSCLVLGIKVTDTCEGATNARIENTAESDVLEIFNTAAPIGSTKVKCSIGGAETGDTGGEFLTLLTSGKALSASE